MKSKSLSLSKLNSPLSSLFKNNKITKSAQSLLEAGVSTIEDLLWLSPLHIHRMPSVQAFDQVQDGSFFKGVGEIINVSARPNFRARGKGGARLFNITAVVKDLKSTNIIHLKWFNSYGSVKTKIEKLSKIQFLGIAQNFNGVFQIINPDMSELEDLDSVEENSLRIQYPTVNGVSSNHVKSIVDKIPESLFLSIEETLPEWILEKNNLMSNKDTFLYLHGHPLVEKTWTKELHQKAIDRLIYEELFNEQIKITLRRQHIKKGVANKFPVTEKQLAQIKAIFPYEMTNDQNNAIKEIISDLNAGTPMMRMIQGDVGCGKTAVATVSGLIIINHGYQVALMCPTEVLANQHYQTLVHETKGLARVELLTGGMNAKQKKSISDKLKSGEIDFIIGTHTLFQDSIEFKNLGLAIIDEQHKFGVNQRLKMLAKNPGAHCLIMTATPIPRSLSLTQYGDLDISIIKTLPATRKGQKTRIVTTDTYQQYLGFIKTRLSMDEQAYIVVPAITESENIDIENLNDTLKKYRDFFPEYIIEGLHGQLKSNEKDNIINLFLNKKINMLVSTSVIEVGINIHNATIMSILNPERFGLSSLHQLRGRVGRGEKQGFCFLVVDKEVSKESIKRLQVIEKNNDGFIIAEEDLKIRGEGDLFGSDQSGTVTKKKFANSLIHYSILMETRQDLQMALDKKDSIIAHKLGKLSQDQRVFATI